MAGQAGRRKLSAVPARNRGGRPRTRVSSAVAEGSERELLVVLRRKAATMLDKTSSPSAAQRLLDQVLKYDRMIRALDAEAEEAASAAADAADDEDGSADESFDVDAL